MRSFISLNRWRARWRAFCHPIDPERAELLRSRWASLPQELKTSNQLSGRHLTHCGFITGASYCSFRCTHCYLPSNANRVPIPSLAEVKEQIDANRRFQGPGGGLQITGGDVADAYWRSGRQDELTEIVRYSVQSGLVPMLMTHGQTLLEHPAFLKRLVREGGLRQVAVHIDTTQVGRKGFPADSIRTEADLNPLRDAFTDLVFEIREKTGLPLELAHNCTVTGRNIDSIAELVRWFLAEPRRTQIWRNLSFLPEANTGRTTFSENPVSPNLVWQKICDGVGQSLDGHAFMGGHPDCNRGATLLMSRRSGTVMALLPNKAETQQLLAVLLDKIGALSTITTDGDPNLTGGFTLLPWRLAGALAQNPVLAVRAFVHFAGLLCDGSIPSDFLFALLSGRAHTINIGTHNFMHASLVAAADRDPVVRARLDACVFKGAVKNRKSGEWEAIPMCAMNEGRWSQLYAERLGIAYRQNSEEPND